MASFSGASLVSHGLTYFVDFGNQEKSFQGATTTNIAEFPATGYNWVNSGAGDYTNNDTTEVLPSIPNSHLFTQPLRVVSCTTTTASAQGLQCGYMYTSISPSTQYTMSLWYKKNRQDMGSYGPYLRQSVNNNWHASFDYLGDTQPANWPTNEWIRIKATFTTDSNETGVYLSNYIGAQVGDKVSYTGGQLEARGFASPLWQGTRNTAQSVVDLTGNRTTGTSNITFPPNKFQDNYPYLNCTNSAIITDSSSILNTDTHSVFFMIRFNTTSSYGSNGYSGSWDMIFQFAPSGTDRSPGIWRYPSQRYIHWRYDPSNSGCDFGKNSSNQDFDIDTWYYVGVTKNGANTVQYVNGKQVGTGSVSNPKISGDAAVILFPYYPQDLASMGLCQIYNRVLTDNEVAQNFAAIRSRYGI